MLLLAFILIKPCKILHLLVQKGLPHLNIHDPNCKRGMGLSTKIQQIISFNRYDVQIINSFHVLIELVEVIKSGLVLYWQMELLERDWVKTMYQIINFCLFLNILSTFCSTHPTPTEHTLIGWHVYLASIDFTSVGTRTQGQLFQLMQRLESTTPHFIRCIKPNNVQSPGSYEQSLVLQQLRCCGVLEVVRISRSGFPTRVPHQKFAGRYDIRERNYVD